MALIFFHSEKIFGYEQALNEECPDAPRNIYQLGTRVFSFKNTIQNDECWEIQYKPIKNNVKT
ncbi:hypothetical protein Glove_186g48 [Diversispora epigaea]|uniref:Uncharacterized protein n=1 Tax=Diversispora epigaea TaxID=1348612 RepID=A0A397IM97_9GLOM|nr:hypothetical protein Glove_186g48 [Diversispora epigaea]